MCSFVAVVQHVPRRAVIQTGQRPAVRPDRIPPASQKDDHHGRTTKRQSMDGNIHEGNEMAKNNTFTLNVEVER